MLHAPRLFKPIAPTGISSTQYSIEAFKVVTYNLLADKYAIGGHHRYCPEEHLIWSSREPRIMAELDSYKADIICLQEVERPYMEDELGPWLREKGYEVS